MVRFLFYIGIAEADFIVALDQFFKLLFFLGQLVSEILLSLDSELSFLDEFFLFLDRLRNSFEIQL